MASTKYSDPSLYDKSLLNKYGRITSLETSSKELGDFESDKPSFFELVEPIMTKFANPGVPQEDSFFFIFRFGVLNSSLPIHPGVSARMIWAAARMVQTSLGAILAKCQDDFSRFKTQDYASVIKQGLSSLRIVLVRVSFFHSKGFYTPSDF